MRQFWLALLIIGGFAAGCLESNPQPSPFGKDEPGTGEDQDSSGGGAPEPGNDELFDGTVDSSKVVASAPTDDGTVLIIGLDEAAPGASQGHFEQEDGDGGYFREGFAVREDGGFFLTLLGVQADSVLLTFGYPDSPYVAMLDVVIPVHDPEDGATPWFVDSASNFREPTAGYPPEGEDWAGGTWQDPRVTVSYLEAEGMAQIAATVYVVTPLSQLVLTNLSTEATLMGQANNQGAFLVKVPASRGDTIGIFATNPLDSSKATPPLFVMVPRW
jgi:hypothetical protein